MKNQLLISLLLAFFCLESFGQVNISGVINEQTFVSVVSQPNCSECDDNCRDTVFVSDATLFNAGDRALIIQIKGATVNTSNTSSGGQITDIGNAGNYEFFIIDSIDVATNAIFPEYGLIRTYDETGFVQVIRIPNYGNSTVTIDDTLTAPTWDENTGEGGVVALVAKKLVFNAPIDVIGAGFKGNQMLINGTPDNCSVNPTSAYNLASTASQSFTKGEGIVVDNTAVNRGRAPRANGGGSGISGDSGGGGGSSYGAGGIGGKRWCNVNGTDAGGLGGVSLATYFEDDRLFLGGAGGSGYVTTNNPSDATDGGGIVIIFADTIEGNGFSILADGTTPIPVNTVGAPDGGGGGGGGGSVLLKTQFISDSLTVSVNGGDGQSLLFDAFDDDVPHGPGGGGGGGVLLHSLPVLPPYVTFSANGGNPGEHEDGFVHAAQAGQDGDTFSLYVPIENVNYRANVDNDDVPANCDIDDDNDGIPDIREIYIGDHDGDGTLDYEDPQFCDDVFGAVPGYDCSVDGLPNPSADIDGDGYPNFFDDDFPYCGSLLPGIDQICSAMDLDGDGVPNHLDLDSDNDGIPDIIEAGGTDIDGDGLSDETSDIDNDGLVDLYDTDDTDGPSGTSPCPSPPGCLESTSTSTHPIPDTDGDNIADYLDLDSDNDGIPDVVEIGGTDENGDGRIDDYGDSDDDGYSDIVDGLVCEDSVDIVPPNQSFGTYLSGPSNGIGNGGNASGAPDGSFAQVYDSGDNLVIDLGQVFPIGTNYTLTWRRKATYGAGPTADMVVEESTSSGGGFSTNSFTPQDATQTFVNTVMITEVSTRYIRLSTLTGSNDDFDFDAVTLGSAITSYNVYQVCEAGSPLIVTGPDGNSDGIPDSYPSDDFDEDGILDYLDLDADNDGIPDVVEAGGTDADGDGIADNFIDNDEDGFNDVVDGDPTNVLVISDDNDGANSDNALQPTNQDANRDGIPDGYPEGDTDGDGNLDQLDLDADNDGIPDVVEAGGVDTDGDGFFDDLTDSDTDGFADDVDGDVGNDGTAENSSQSLQLTGADGDSDGAPDSYPNDDLDGDNLPNQIDIDSDNDGITDVIEAGGADANQDGRIDGNGTDTDDDGYADGVDGDVGNDGTAENSGNSLILTGVDANNDGVPDSVPNGDSDGDDLYDFIDIDADNDGIVDNTEALSTAGYVAPAGTDTDGDGLDDSYDPDNGGTYTVPEDTDGDSTPDYLDRDSDGDGLFDIVEGHDSDGDNIPDASSPSNTGLPGGTTDVDNDGLYDGWDNNTASTDATNGALQGNSHPNVDNSITPERDWREAQDVDNDGIADYIDLDDDNDGIPDTAEVNLNEPDGDEDGDGILNWFDTNDDGAGDGSTTDYTDSNGDGVPDVYDFDGDGVPNHLDLDSDNDGIPDLVEAGGADDDGDGVSDVLDDIDNDGWPDIYDSNLNGTSNETAADLTQDCSGTTNAPSHVVSLNVSTTDVTSDPTLFWYLRGDYEQPGFTENITVTADGTGLGSFDRTDSDNPTYTDCSATPMGFTLTISQANWNTWNDDGVINLVFQAASGVNFCDDRSCLDSVRFNYTITTSGSGTPIGDRDTDGDGNADHLDLDADNDGIPDVVEAGGTDADGDGIFDDQTDSDNDGFADDVDGDVGNDGTAENSVNVLQITDPDGDNDGLADAYPSGDTDGDGILDQLDLDADNDGIPDVVEAGGTDTDGDGIFDDQADTDGDGFADDVDGDVGNDGTAENSSDALQLTGADGNNDGAPDSYPDGDTDNDGILDQLDLDADDDGIPDVVEAGGTDTDGDGIFDDQTDSDNDGFADDLDGDVGNDGTAENTTHALQITGVDGDNDGAPDSVVSDDSDGDGIPNQLDIDSDDDGITDVIEAGGIDSDEDGRIDGNGTDTDTDGFADGVDGDVGNDGTAENSGNALVLTGSDGNNDGTPDSFTNANSDDDDLYDFIDIDADNDGIVDNTEAQSTSGYAAPSGSDTDGDGLDNAYDPDNSGTYVNPEDTDSDGIADYLDLDSDNDGASDLIEGHDSDDDLIADVGSPANSGVSGGTTDADNDGLYDGWDNNTGSTDPTNNSLQGSSHPDVNAPGNDRDWREIRDVDGDGVADAFDLDNDNDGILDIDERNCTDGFADAVTLNDGVGGATNALSYPDNSVATVANGDTLIIDLTSTVPEGSTILLRMRRNNNARMSVMGSVDNVTYTNATTYGSNGSIDVPLTLQDVLYNVYYVAGSGGVRYLRFAREAGSTGVDAVMYTPSCGPVDTDGDGIEDYLDLDSDNDGIPDLVEAGGVDTDGDGVIDNLTDSDGDGWQDVYDTDNGGDALTNADTDGDGINDFLDLDADNDGIPDVVEAGGTDTDGDGFFDDQTDSDGDGFPDDVDGDVGNDGTAENSANALQLTGGDGNSDGVPDSYPEGDTDGDGVLDQLDLDADNDGIPDVVEAGGTDADGDGIFDDQTDGDNDGFADDVDGDADNDGTAENTSQALQITGADGDNDGAPDSVVSDDPDGDGIPNQLDIDSDDDGITDVIEAGGVDANEDGRIDGNGTDTDSDGFADGVDGDVGNDGTAENTGNALIATGTDADNNGVPDNFPNGNTDDDDLYDFIDIDADNDGIVDNSEAQSTAGYDAPDGSDTDGDGLDDAYDPDNGGTYTNPVDTDSDGTPDYQDLDTDGDGIPDVVEGHDTDGDYFADASSPANTGLPGGTTDTDNDGLYDGWDNNTSSTDPTNSSLTPSSHPNVINSATAERDWREVRDTDGDGVPDHLDIDDDNDGIRDVVEANGNDPDGDEDGDGIANFVDTNDDGNGGDGTITDYTDSDANGIPDVYEFDDDGIPNHLDKDADNDGITDIIEAFGTDGDFDGEVLYQTPLDPSTMVDVDNDGLWDIVDDSLGAVTNGTPWLVPNTDGQGLPNFLDIDSDDDGIVDNTEAQATGSYIAPALTDTDRDGINDANDPDDGGTYLVPVNTDGTGFPDFVDTDSDDDGEDDSIEGHDTDGDGTADATSPANTGESGGNTDADGDGLLDGWDNDNASRDPTNGALTPGDHPDADAGGTERDWREVPCAGGTVILAPNNATTTASDFCVDGDWTAYYNPSNPSELLFAIQRFPAGGNTNEFTVSIDITTSADPLTAGGMFINENIGAQEATVVMGRYYNISITSGTLNGPVNIRFYYSPSEISAVEAVSDAWNNANAGGTGFVSGSRWFMMNSGTFDPSSADLQQNGIQDARELIPAATGTTDGVNYAQFNGLNSLTGGGLAFTIGANSVILPVEWLYFDAEKQGSDALLEWSTATEKDADRYEVLRSDDAVNFKHIGTVQAAGTTTDQSFYEFVDKNPYSGINYYKLRQVDFDGEFMFSEVRTVEFDADETSLTWKIIPNPNFGEFRIEVSRPERFDLIELKTLTGQLVESWNGDALSNTIDVNGLSKGTYIISLTGNGKTEVGRVIVY